MEADRESGFAAALAARPPPSMVSLSPFSPSVSPSPRRLSSHFTDPRRPIRAARQLAWVSLQGRLVGAEEASSARAIGVPMSPKEAVAWELFSPIHRILIVAVVAVATAKLKEHKQICQLKKSVELRDQVLLSMQQKLDNLCEQMNYIKDQPAYREASFTNNVEFQFNELSASDKMEFIGCGCKLCDQHRPPSNDSGNLVLKASSRDEMFKYKMTLTNEIEPDERRMSDLSDWASSVTSSVDVQFNTLAIEQDIYTLKKECEEKDATIKELSTFVHSSEVAGSKRIAELEDIIRRKNMIITKLRKDMVILEQKVVHLTRLRRPSFSVSSSNVKSFPIMTDNLVYDMDSTTSPSSSDSDSTPRNRPQPLVARSQEFRVQNFESASRRNQKSGSAKGSSSSVKPTDRQQKSRPVSPLKEKSMNLNNSVSSLRPKYYFINWWRSQK
ncbi:hypothetical protein F0562_001429 [Nyssa sinensis]|uniref:Uncharacterized protein n=1 Tax=Nyssa sinensis TaxID=561372 RepID=A0A5J5C2C1_9ASTE|nr:hypothetical protein F0562_001429 [Nyssa sinensis]